MSLDFARVLAVRFHGDQKWSEDRPYIDHLNDVVDVLTRFGHTDSVILAAAILHDIVEDTAYTLDDIAEDFGFRTALLVWAVTNEPGKNRKERHIKTYPKARAVPDAITLKLADRISNVAASLKTGTLIGMYRKEWAEFQAALRPFGGDEAMWKHLTDLMEPKP